jgi:hypothetical protein
MSDLPERRLVTYQDIEFDGDQLVAIILEGDGVAILSSEQAQYVLCITSGRFCT